MKLTVLSLSVVLALLLSGCGFKRDCDTRKEWNTQSKNSSKSEIKKNEKIYIGE